MSKVSVYVILTGILLVLSSCAPLVKAVYRMIGDEPPTLVSFATEGLVRESVDVEQNTEIQLRLVLEFAAGGGAAYGARYLLEAGDRGDELGRWSGVIERDDVNPDVTRSRANGRILIEKRFPVIELVKGQQMLSVQGHIEEVHTDGPALLAASLQVHRDPPYVRTSFVGAVALWIVGILLALIGAIHWIRSISLAPARVLAGKEARPAMRWCMSCHLSALLGYVIPFGHIIGPAVIWVTRRDSVPGVDEAGRESLNFQLTVTLFALVGVMLSLVFVGLVLLGAVIVAHFCLTVCASVKAHRGGLVRYPLNLRIIKGPQS